LALQTVCNTQARDTGTHNGNLFVIQSFNLSV
jgi:hypothetical protein